MVTSLKWIKEYVPDLDVTAQEYVDAMTLSGSKVEGYTRLDEDLDQIVIGQVLSVDPHPDADKLVVCQVNIGSETLQIVTGAPNVFAGAKVAVVVVGGKVAGTHAGGGAQPGGVVIKAGKLRGVESCGMMCSIEEMGSNSDVFPDADPDGIYILPDDAVVGEDAIAYLGLDDVIVEYEITSNRVDCFSVIGIAREAAATFHKDFVPPVVTETGNDEDVNDYIKVTIEEPGLCTRYTARVVKNIRLAPSPDWMRRRLAAHGIRPINNIVDITNYVMEEYGQPMHSYDLDTIAGHEIRVRRACDGEDFVTLDGQHRALDKDVLLICDGEKAVGLAGIMGGENSMITDDVKTMLFEAACFDGTNIRLSSKRIGLRTDASSKFEKGLDPNNAIEAMNRACQLIEMLDAGDVVGGVVDVYGKPMDGHRIPFDADWINGLLGTDIDAETMKGYFKKIDLGFDEETQEVIAPSWRQDLLRDADIAEEVARFYGYDNIPTTLPRSTTAGRPSDKLTYEALARKVAMEYGFSQGMTYSFESPKVYDKLLVPADDALRNAIEISNPLGEDFSIMRTTPLNGMLASLATNFNRRNKNVRLFELGNIYLAEELPLAKLPDERMQLTLGFYGDGDFYTMKGVVEELLATFGYDLKKVSYDPDAGLPFMHPGRQANVVCGKEKLGYLGEVHPTVSGNYGIKGEVYVAVIDMPALVEGANFDCKYEGIARFPAVTRDLSLVVPKDILAGQVEAIFNQRGGKMLESVKLFDVYQGSQVKEGYKSLAYTLTFRLKDRTLTEADITSVMKKIMNGLDRMGVELRQ